MKDANLSLAATVNVVHIWIMVDPIPMILHCPRCSLQHVDEPNPTTGWDNPPHRSHECQNCGYIWRVADVATMGVRTITTKGTRDNHDFTK